MKRLLVCAGILLNMEVQASSIFESFDQWNMFSNVCPREPELEQDEEARYGCIIQANNQTERLNIMLACPMPNVISDFFQQWYDELIVGNPKTIALTLSGIIHVAQLMRAVRG